MSKYSRRRFWRALFSLVRFSFQNTIELRRRVLDADSSRARLHTLAMALDSSNDRIWDLYLEQSARADSKDVTIHHLRKELSQARRALEASHKPKLP